MDIDIDRTVTTAATTPEKVRSSIRDSIRLAFEAQTLPKPIRLAVPSIEGCSVRFDVEGINSETMAEYGKRVGVDVTKADASMSAEQNVRSSAMLMADVCLGIFFGDDQWHEAGEPVTFRSTPFHEMVGEDNWVDAIRRFYGVDADIIATAAAIITNCGLFGDRVVPIKGR